MNATAVTALLDTGLVTDKATPASLVRATANTMDRPEADNRPLPTRHAANAPPDLRCQPAALLKPLEGHNERHVNATVGGAAHQRGGELHIG